MKTYIGVDLGGTNVRAAIVDEMGNILCDVKEVTEVEKGAKHIREKIKHMITSLDGYDTCAGIGIGVPGPVDAVTRKMTLCTNIPVLQGYPLAEELEEALHIPVWVDNDCNCAGIGEALLGAGKGYRHVYYITISTGIGGTLIVDETIISGKNGYAGEIANLVIDPHLEKQNHLNAGAVENEASGTAITKKGKAVFGEDEIAHAGDVFELARKGDTQALVLTSKLAHDLAMMFSMVAHVCDPDIFVLGGGVMKGKDVFFEEMVNKYHSLVHPGMRNVEFTTATLTEPGVVGAAMLAKSNLK